MGTMEERFSLFFSNKRVEIEIEIETTHGRK
jgi:hypothetical protein